jgi:acetyltransferase-like isoleucine patch superfamily enzyme
VVGAVLTRIARIRRVLADLIGTAVLWVPGRAGSELRVAYYRARGVSIGRRVRIDVGVIIDGPTYVHIGDHTWLDRYAILIAGPTRADRETRMVGVAGAPGRLAIGDRCHIGPHAILSGLGGLEIGDDVTAAAGTKIYSLTHHYRSWAKPWDAGVAFGSMAPAARQSMLQGPIRIASNVGLGVDVLVLPGSEIGQCSFVRPRTTVSGQWPANSILEGDPVARSGPRFLESGAVETTE